VSVDLVTAIVIFVISIACAVRAANPLLRPNKNALAATAVIFIIFFNWNF
jgi:hypothetical protein